MQQLESFTDNFSKERELGEGTYGLVYKGSHENGEEIAVKVLHENSEEVAGIQFENELAILQKLEHPNIVKLVGYNYQSQFDYTKNKDGKGIFAGNEFRALCIEFMPKGSLEAYLSDECKGLNWYRRYWIIRRTCEGLKYLHNGLETPVLHLDIKPDNILLDKYMEPKLADFGVSRYFNEEEIETDKDSLGTRGYIPPEHIDEGIVSKKFDIYSLGVVMLEIVAGRRRQIEWASQEFTSQVVGNWNKRLQLLCLGPTLETYCKQVRRCTEIALKCIQPDRHKRPDIVDIIHGLKDTEKIIPGWSDTPTVYPTVLRFALAKTEWLSSPLSLINMTDTYAGFVILNRPYEETIYTTDLWIDVLEPNSTKLVTVLRITEQPPPLSNENFEILMVTMDTEADLIGLKGVISSYPPDADKLLKRIAALGGKVLRAMLTDAVRDPARETTMTTTKIIPPKQFGEIMAMDTHSTEPWIFIGHSEGYVSVWNYLTQEKGIAFDLKDLKGKISTIKFNSREKSVAVGSLNSGYIHVYKFPSMRLVKRISINTTIGRDNGRVYSIDVHPSSPLMLSLSFKNKHINLLGHSDRGSLFRPLNSSTKPKDRYSDTKRYNEKTYQIKFSLEDPNTFASTGKKGPVKIWSIISSNDNFNDAPHPVAELAGETSFDFPFTNSDRQFIITSDSDTVKVWDLQTTKFVHKFNVGDSVLYYACHPTLDLFVTGSDDAGILYLWNTTTYMLEKMVRCTPGKVYSLKFTALGRLMIQYSDRIEVLEFHRET